MSSGLSLFQAFEVAAAEEEGPPEPREPPLPAVNPAWLTPLCDANTEKAIFVWFKLVYDGTSDLDPQECGTDCIGGPPEWTDHEDDLSLGTVMSPAWTHTTVGGHDFPDQWLRWGLENGIAPGQPFLVRIGRPHYYKCSYEYEEYDCEWDVEVVRTMPRSQRQALRAWAAVLPNIQRYYALFLERRDRLRHLQDTDVAAFSLQAEHYNSQGYYDEMSPPSGLRLYLCSYHSSMWSLGQLGPRHPRHPHRLVSGEDKNGDYEKAFRDLLRNLKKYRPAINLAAVLPLSGGRAKITRWEHLNLSLEDDERCT